jgi:hypothetical protein
VKLEHLDSRIMQSFLEPPGGSQTADGTPKHLSIERIDQIHHAVLQAAPLERIHHMEHVNPSPPANLPQIMAPGAH